MITANQLFHQAQEQAWDETIQEIASDITVHSLMGCIFFHSNEWCDLDFKHTCVPIIDLLEKDWEETAPETQLHPNQSDEMREEWTKLLDQLEVFTKEKRELLQDDTGKQSPVE
jgi:hypothetical protein